MQIGVGLKMAIALKTAKMTRKSSVISKLFLYLLYAAQDRIFLTISLSSDCKMVNAEINKPSSVEAYEKLRGIALR
jgi:hypothetical protein